MFRKTNISYPLIRTRTCVHQGIRNNRFSEDFTYVLNGWTLTEKNPKETNTSSLLLTWFFSIPRSMVWKIVQYLENSNIICYGRLVKTEGYCPEAVEENYIILVARCSFQFVLDFCVNNIRFIHHIEVICPPW